MEKLKQIFDKTYKEKEQLPNHDDMKLQMLGDFQIKLERLIEIVKNVKDIKSGLEIKNTDSVK